MEGVPAMEDNSNKSNYSVQAGYRGVVTSPKPYMALSNKRLGRWK